MFTSNDRLKIEYFNLTTDFKALKTQLNQTKLANTELKGQYMEAKEQLTMMDVEHTKTMNRCEVLTQVICICFLYNALLIFVCEDYHMV